MTVFAGSSDPNVRRMRRILAICGALALGSAAIAHAEPEPADAGKDEAPVVQRGTAPGVDAIVVVGGRESANTRRLVELCRAIRPEATFHVESAAELPVDEITACPVIGVTAGASTPEWVIAEVVEHLRQLG